MSASKNKERECCSAKPSAANTVHAGIAQINVKVAKQGSENIFETKKEQTEEAKDAEKEKSEKPSEKKEAKTAKKVAEDKTSEKGEES